MRCLTGHHGCRVLQIFTAHPEENVKALLQPWQWFLKAHCDVLAAVDFTPSRSGPGAD
jgi:hypothetical protein